MHADSGVNQKYTFDILCRQQQRRNVHRLKWPLHKEYPRKSRLLPLPDGS